MILWPPAAATSSGRLTCACPFTSEKSVSYFRAIFIIDSRSTVRGANSFSPFRNSTVSSRDSTGNTGIPPATAASSAFCLGSMIPLSFFFPAITAMLRAPRIGLSPPWRLSSPRIRWLSSISEERIPLAESIPTAIGRSNAEPSFFTSAGARLTVIFLFGNR